MVRFVQFSLMTFIVISCVYSQETDSQDPRDRRNVKAVRFVPPPDLIKIETLEIVGTEDFHRLSIPTMESAREKVLGVPVKNLSDKTLTVTNVYVGCGCMAAITDDLDLASGETTMIFLRITPQEIGRFAKQMKISFENASPVTCVIESVVKPSFAITPNSVLLRPGDSNGSELTVKPMFGQTGFGVKSTHPLLKLKYDRMDENQAYVYKCWLEKEFGGTVVSEQLIAPIHIEHLGKSYEYSLNVQNSLAVKILPRIAFASRGSQTSDEAELFVLLGSWYSHDDLKCVVAEPSMGLTIEEVKREMLAEGSIFQKVTLSIRGNLEKIDTVTLNCIRAGEVVGTTQVFLNDRSELAQQTLREANRERNRQLIEQRQASALEPAE